MASESGQDERPSECEYPGCESEPDDLVLVANSDDGREKMAWLCDKHIEEGR